MRTIRYGLVRYNEHICFLRQWAQFRGPAAYRKQGFVKTIIGAIVGNTPTQSPILWLAGAVCLPHPPPPDAASYHQSRCISACGCSPEPLSVRSAHVSVQVLKISHSVDAYSRQPRDGDGPLAPMCIMEGRGMTSAAHFLRAAKGLGYSCKSSPGTN